MKQVPKGFERLPVGDKALTRRVLKRCRDASLNFEIETKRIKIGRHKSGTKITGHIVPEGILKEERDRRMIELESMKKRKADVRAKRILTIRQRRLEEERIRFPQLSLEAVTMLVDSGRPIYADGNAGCQSQVGTEDDWSDLGFSVSGEPTGFLVLGKSIFDTYSSKQIEPRISQMTLEQLKCNWIRKYGSEELMLAHAIRIANRLQKVNRIRGFYKLKNEWILANQKHLTKTRKTGVESKTCKSCKGTGRSSFLAACNGCGGRGVKSPRMLYEYEFLIQGIRFRIHSPLVPNMNLPENVEEDATMNGIEIGRPWSQDDIPLPPQRIIVDLIIDLLPATDRTFCRAGRVLSPIPQTSSCLRILSHDDSTPSAGGNQSSLTH